MQIRIIPVVLMLAFSLPAAAQQADTIIIMELDEVEVKADSYKRLKILATSLPVEVADKSFLHDHFSGNLIQALEYLPGMRSMDIGSGFSKPMIRGMSFNRISVVENGIKQEGQQWGGDHGLEMDVFGIERVVVIKGPASLLYGSDAIAGVIEISEAPAPRDNQIFGEGVMLGKSVNGTIGGSLMFGIKRNAWYTKLRYSEQHFGDYRVPTDTMVYLTQRIPIYDGRLKNTAGYERDASLYTEYRKGRYYSNYALSNVYQKTGFFPGAHGIPDISRVQDDGDHRDIDLPYSLVNHLKASSRQQYSWSSVIGSLDLGYQNNHREEWSRFHTHYGTQPPPPTDPDMELQFALQTFTSSLKAHWHPSTMLSCTFGWDAQYQQNRIGGYSFLLPHYDRFTTGAFAIADWCISQKLSISGGLRYDFGKVDIAPYSDPYLETYLEDMDYPQEVIDQYLWRSYAVDRRFGDPSGSLGVVWSPDGRQLVKANIGHSFRLPGANELAANGIHHGTFRHEQGDATLSSEHGWQLDASYLYHHKWLSFSVAPFVSWFSNYIYLQPTGEWSILPHAGQIYRYTEAEAILAGGELTFDADITRWLKYSLGAEYVYTLNLDEDIPLSFSPPATMRHILTWHGKRFEVSAELQSIARQDRVARNESPTPGANIVNLGGRVRIPLGNVDIEIDLAVRNLLNTKYYNNLSFYRQVEIPEPGQNFQLTIRVPFNIKINENK